LKTAPFIARCFTRIEFSSHRYSSLVFGKSLRSGT